MKKISLNFKIRLIQVFLHILSLYGLYLILFQDLPNKGLYLLISLFSYWVIGTLGINICLHRYLAHRNFKCNRAYKILMLFFSTICVVGTPLSWPAIHRWHHIHSDTEKDPHSPHKIGNLKSWIGLWNKTVIPVKLSRDLYKDTDIKFFHRHYIKIVVGIHLIVAYFNPLLWIFLLVIPATLCLHATSSISVLCHRFGYRNFETKDQSYNNWIASIITLGEGWHNNHHANPASLKQGLNWWEFDIPYLIIRVIKNQS